MRSLYSQESSSLSLRRRARCPAGCIGVLVGAAIQRGEELSYSMRAAASLWDAPTSKSVARAPTGSATRFGPIWTNAYAALPTISLLVCRCKIPAHKSHAYRSNLNQSKKLISIACSTAG